MPLKLDDIDLAILKSILEDGRKSYRRIAKEINVSAPTVKIRYERLFSVGLIKSISPILDPRKLDKSTRSELDSNLIKTKKPKINLNKEMQIKLTCKYCKGPIGSKPHIVRFANFERYFCCTSCKGLYKEKYRGRIEAVTKRAQN